MAEVYFKVGRTESLIMPRPTIGTHATENSRAAMLENILARLTRIETRLIERERREAVTLPPLRPEPDPPDGPPLYAATQPQIQSTGYLQSSLTPYTYATSLLHQTHQPPPPPNTCPPPPNTHQPLYPPQTYQQQPLKGRATQTQQFPQPNSGWYPSTHQLHTPPQYPSYTGGPTTYSGYELYEQHIPQPPDPEPLYGMPTYTGQPATGWCPLTSHHRTAAPLPAVAVPPCRGCPMEAVAVAVEEYKSCSEVMLFNGKSYDGADVSEEEEELFEEDGIAKNMDEGKDTVGVLSIEKEDTTMGERELGSTREEEMTIDFAVEAKPKEICDDTEYPGHEEVLVWPGDVIEVHPQNRMIKGTRLLGNDGVGEVPLEVLDISMAKRNLPRRYVEGFFKRKGSRMFSKSSRLNKLMYVIVFDPGGESSPRLRFASLFSVLWFPP